MANVKCPKCGNLISGVQAGQTISCSQCGYSMKLSGSSSAQASSGGTAISGSKGGNAPLATWKLVSGILSMVLFILVSFQSCAAGLGNAISDNGEVSGSAGIIVAIMLLTGGIVSVATRKGGKGGDIALIVLYGIGAFIGFIFAGSYGDLRIWAFWCLVCVVLAIASMTKKK